MLCYGQRISFKRGRSKLGNGGRNGTKALREWQRKEEIELYESVEKRPTENAVGDGKVRIKNQ